MDETITVQQLNHEIDWVKGMIEDQIAAVRREMAQTNATSAAAITKSEAGYEKRFEIQNEFRAQVNDQAGRFVTSAEYHTAHKSVEDSITKLTDRFNLSEGRDSGKDTSKTELRSNVTAGIGVLVGVASLFLFLSGLNSKVDRNSEARTNQPIQTVQTQPAK